ncbi:MAG: hypothetical protein FJZ67_00200 [Bacteroidetes bacterium]|nr:hypothetical protein [Bacteroidota bacterium]
MQIKFFFSLAILFSLSKLISQENYHYKFNGSKDTFFLRDYANSFYTEKGFPVNLDGAFIIEPTKKHQTWAVHTLDTVRRTTATFLIANYEINPETQEREKVIIDKFIVKIKGAIKPVLWLGNSVSGEKIDTTAFNVHVEFDNDSIKAEYKIESFDLVYGSTIFSSIGKSLTKSMIDFILALKKDEKVLLDVTCSDLRGTKKQIRGSFVR